MKEVRIGIVGLGFMGTTHFRIYKELPNARIAAVADVDPAKLKGDVSGVVGNIVGSDNSVPLDMTGVRTYATADALIDDPEVDVVDIAVPTPDHQRIAMAALRRGKHVFCEKPVCRTLKELEELAGCVRYCEGFFNVGMCVRAWPEYYHVRNLYRDGRLGRVRTAFLHRLSPNIAGNAWRDWYMEHKSSGGALLDLHLHDSDFILFMFGRPARVTSFGCDSFRSDGGVDYVMTHYHYPDCVVSAEGGWCAERRVPFEMSFQMVFEKATVRFDGASCKIYWEGGEIETLQVSDAALPTGWHQELAYFVDCVAEGVKPDKYQTLDGIIDSFKLIMAEQESVDCGATVEVKY